MFRTLKARIICYFKGHDIDCAIAAIQALNLQCHVHTCYRCGKLLKNDIGPVDSDVNRLLTDMGLTPQDQATIFASEKPNTLVH